MSNFPRMVQEYTERRFNEFDSKRQRKFDRIDSKAGMEKYVLKCQRTIRRLFNLPKNRTALKTKVTGEIKHDSYRIEKILFESRPGFQVTANLYIPSGSGPFPCVLGACGHSNEGKAADFYQSFSAGLASKGFMVLTYDPIGQGERFQYPDIKDKIPGCVAEHITNGNQQYLLGDWFGTWRSWDGIRALDVLLERPEADPKHVGMTGNSGGGTMTTNITALEDRLTMAAPSCYITSYRRNLENELPADTEQILPGIIRAGYEEFDHITATAPRPTLLCTKEDDFFDQRGSQEAYQHLKRVYTLLERPDDIEIVTGKGGHGFSQDLREAMYGFFCKHAGIQADAAEPEIQLHSVEELNCTPSGQVVKEGSKRVVDFTRRKLAKMRRKRKSFNPETLKKLLKLEDLPAETPAHRVLRRQHGKSRISVQTEENIFAVFKYLPVSDNNNFRIPVINKAVLYLPHIDDEEEYENEPFLKEYLEKDIPVFNVSVRGIGESKYGTCGRGNYLMMYDAEFFYSSLATQMGFPLAGRRVFDLLRVVQLLKAHGYTSFELAGRGLGGVIALYAAPFIPEAGTVRIKNCIPGFDDMIAADLHGWPAGVLVSEMLKHFDLPDIVNYLKKDREVELLDPWDATLNRGEEFKA